MEVSDEPELLFTSEGQHHVLISEPVANVNVSDSDVLNVMATTIAPKLVNVPIGGAPLNEFEDMPQILAGGFPDLFVLGHPYTEETKTLSNKQIRHLTRFHDGRYLVP